MGAALHKEFRQIESPSIRQEDYNPNVYAPLERILQAKARAGDGSAPHAAVEEAEEESAETQPAPSKLALETFYPNPTSGAGTLPLVLPEEAKVEARVYDVMGQQVATLAEGRYEAGRHRLHFEGEGLPSGVYVIRAKVHPADGEARGFTRKVTVVK